MASWDEFGLTVEDVAVLTLLPLFDEAQAIRLFEQVSLEGENQKCRLFEQVSVQLKVHGQ